jgi:hypothetical protein
VISAATFHNKGSTRRKNSIPSTSELLPLAQFKCSLNLRFASFGLLCVLIGSRENRSTTATLLESVT